MKITKVKRYGALRFERLMVSDYSKTKRDMLDDYGIVIPSAKELDLWHEDDLRMLLNQVMIHVHHKSGEVWVYTFRKGWIFDTASVPKFMRSLIDNDERRLLVPAMIHDANFRVRAGLAWFAVSSFVGRIKFNRYKDKKKVGKYRQTVSFHRYPKRDAHLVAQLIRHYELDKVSQ
jgi:hypothetical protein